MRLVRQYLPNGAPVYNTEGSSQNNGFDPRLVTGYSNAKLVGYCVII